MSLNTINKYRVYRDGLTFLLYSDAGWENTVIALTLQEAFEMWGIPADASTAHTYHHPSWDEAWEVEWQG